VLTGVLTNKSAKENGRAATTVVFAKFGQVGDCVGAIDSGCACQVARGQERGRLRAKFARFRQATLQVCKQIIVRRRDMNGLLRAGLPCRAAL
jgi:hypothetical protein